MKLIALIFFIFTVKSIGFGQDKNWLTFPSDEDTVSAAEVELDYTKNNGNVIVVKDDRIGELEKFVRSGEETIEGVLIDGYRVLIYFDQNKSNAEQQKAKFMKLYDQIDTYIDYLAPNYRVRIGDYRTKLEAEKVKQEILMVFPTAIVVKDKIHLPKIDNTESTN
jgi:hypothetical protein